MSSIPFDPGQVGRAEGKFREAFDRLKQGKPLQLPKGSRVTQNNVAKEAGVDPSALRRTRFPTLVAEIQQWIEAHHDTELQKTPRQMLLAQRSRNRTQRERNQSLQVQRDAALLRLVQAEARILELTIENERLRSQLPPNNVAPMYPAPSKPRGRKPVLRNTPK